MASKELDSKLMMTRAEAAAWLREMADGLEHGALGTGHEALPLERLRKLRVSMVPRGEKLEVKRRVKVRLTTVGGRAAATKPEGDETAESRAADDKKERSGPSGMAVLLAGKKPKTFKRIKKALGKNFKTIRRALDEGGLPRVAVVEAFVAQAAEQRKLAEHPDPAYDHCLEEAKILLDAVRKGDVRKADISLRKLRVMERVCHKKLK